MNLKERISNLKSLKSLTQTTQRNARKEYLVLNQNIKSYIEAKKILTGILEASQFQLKERVETLVTMCLQTIYGSEYEFKLVIEEKRNQLEFRPVVFENGYEIDPKTEMGGGVRDTCAFALRIVLWNLANKSRNTIILDEPFRFLGNYTEKIGSVLRQLSEELNIQFIIITHDDNLKEYADKCFLVEKKQVSGNYISTIKEVS